MDYLLRVWRGEKIDGEKIKEEFMPSKVCAACGIMKKYQAFTATEWKRSDSEGRMVGNCMMCLAEHRRANTPLQCTKCLAWRPESYFAENKRHWGSASNRVCVYCVEKRKCKICGCQKTVDEFTQNEWTHAAWSQSMKGKCQTCMTYNKKNWHCSGCNVSKPIVDGFSDWLMNRGQIK